MNTVPFKTLHSFLRFSDLLLYFMPYGTDKLKEDQDKGILFWGINVKGSLVCRLNSSRICSHRRIHLYSLQLQLFKADSKWILCYKVGYTTVMKAAKSIKRKMAAQEDIHVAFAITPGLSQSTISSLKEEQSESFIYSVRQKPNIGRWALCVASPNQL